MDDFIIIGSGFGGSVSALRLTEKGYRVRVLEAGRRFRPEDFPSTNWNLRDFLWAPRVGCTGIQRITLLNDVLVLSGAGVGGGSLVYGNTLRVPGPAAFDDADWLPGIDWRSELVPWYAKARQMLGVTSHQVLNAGDLALQRYAASIGRATEFGTTDVGIYFGTPGVEVPDPYFGGRGPARTGCTHCGGCMTGCRVGAKNTLDRNYLFMAEAGGAVVEAETEATDIQPLPDGGYRVTVRRSTGVRRGPTRELRARGVVLAAGVLGTVSLLLACRARGTLSSLSPRLGTFVRTNSEALTGARRPGAREYSSGIAIASHLQVDQHTSIEVVRYADGSDAMGLLATLMVGPGTRLTRPLKLIGAAFRHPIRAIRASWPVGWARESIILLVMQSLPNRMRLRLGRRWWWPFSERIVSEPEPGAPRVPSFVEAANRAAEAIAGDIGGVSVGALNEALFNVGTTAHILGGSPMGTSAADGVIDASHRVFGYDNMYVVDGSAVPANLGVNPSLTITAMAERAMSLVPAARDRPITTGANG